jgi:hypothetical protein
MHVKQVPAHQRVRYTHHQHATNSCRTSADPTQRRVGTKCKHTIEAHKSLDLDEIIMNTTMTIMAKVLLVVQASQLYIYNCNNAARKPCNRPWHDRPYSNPVHYPHSPPRAPAQKQGRSKHHRCCTNGRCLSSSWWLAATAAAPDTGSNCSTSS